VTEPKFDGYANEYDAALDEAIGVSGEDKDYFARGRIAWTARVAPEVTAARAVLDYGCGVGDSAPLLAETMAGASVLGVDVSAGSIAVATRMHAGERISFAPLADAKPRNIDVAYCNGVFHHIPVAERDGAASYVRDSLRAGGLFALWENNPWNPATRYVMSRCRFDDDAITLTPPETRKLLQKNGFEVVRTDFLFIFPRSLRWFRGIEPKVAKLPLGTQYLVLARRP
jgi:SAM-dependent methyltransferase